MVRFFSFILLFNFLLSCSNKKDSVQLIDVDNLPLIPYPQELEVSRQFFELNANTTLHTAPVFKTELYDLKNTISKRLTQPLKVSDKVCEANNFLCLKKLSPTDEKPANPEYFELTITEQGITLSAYTNQGLQHGIQTLYQLFVNDFHKKQNRKQWFLPCLTIKDYPQFSHRGLLLDVCRHFYDKDVIKKYIDVLAFYKMNVLHLHLTEDQGWRIPIDKYPKLTEIGAWRLDSHNIKYGGYYSKDELIEIVQYAEKRHITIIPEIEMPGHAQAALAAYPQFSCTGGPIEVVNDWGVFKEIYCAGNDSTYLFIEDILNEVMEIFPSEYIHIGGDEAPKYRWKHCSKCQHKMKEEGLKDEHELQSYFIKRIEKILAINNRKLIGWDEILEGGLTQNATVQSWRGMDGGKIAAESGHKAIMSPTSHCYLDYDLKSIDLKKIYSFDPIPANLAEKAKSNIIGGECNMWTEHVENEKELDRKVFPRMIGLAEVLWTYPKNRKFEEFYLRLQQHYPILDEMKINYGPETTGALLSEIFNSDNIFIALNKNLEDLSLKYFWKNDSTIFQDYLTPIPFKSGELHVQAFKGNLPYGDELIQTYQHHQALNAKVNYQCNYHEAYAANRDRALTDGKIGSLDFRDGAWQGFWDQNVEIILEIKDIKAMKKVSINFYQYANSWIFFPQKVSVDLSEDKKNWHSLSPIFNSNIDLSNEKSIKSFSFPIDQSVKASYSKYIKIRAEGLDQIPAGHEAAGQPTWLFIDEIIVN